MHAYLIVDNIILVYVYEESERAKEICACILRQNKLYQ